MEVQMDVGAKVGSLIEDMAKLEGFDSTLFDQLVEDTSPEVSLKILARFFETLFESLEAIEKGLVAEDADPVWKACHKVAGSAELLGFVVFGKFSRKLNNDIKSLPVLESHEVSLVNYLKQGREVLGIIHKAFPDRKNFLQ